MIIEESARASGAKQFALEVFLLSFALEGMNLADVYTCAPAKVRWLIYNRSKTKTRRADMAEHRVFLPEQIMPIDEKYKDNDASWRKRYTERFYNAEVEGVPEQEQTGEQEPRKLTFENLFKEGV